MPINEVIVQVAVGERESDFAVDSSAVRMGQILGQVAAAYGELARVAVDAAAGIVGDVRRESALANAKSAFAVNAAADAAVTIGDGQAVDGDRGAGGNVEHAARL